MFCIKGKAMSNNATGNETDLDWLARNVHVWLEDANYVCVNHTDGGHVFHEHNRNCAIWFTKGQWLARRAELRNKPSWVSAPKWSEWLSQDSDGGWWFYRQKPFTVDLVWRGTDRDFCNSGEVFGDWRDTLERRPEYTRAETEVELVKAAFEPFASIEDNKEQEMKQDNGWFERGELPPVGIECEVFGEDSSPEKCKVIAYHKDQIAVQWEVFNGGCLDVLYLRGDFWKFRPIRTEREELERLLRSTALSSFDDLDIIAGAIIAAGFRKEQK